MLISRSLSHVAALVGDLFVGIYSGIGFSFYDGEFSPSAIKKEIQAKRLTLWNGTPTCLFFCAALRTELPIRKCVLSGEVLTKSVYERIKKGMRKTKFYVGYGLTEAAPRISMGRLRKKIQRGYAGKLIKGIRAKECDGEIQINTPALASGYVGRKRFAEKWFHTRDRGYIKGKRVYVLGRTDGVIIRGGVNIDPVMIEEAIQSDRNIVNCKVYGSPDGAGASGAELPAGAAPSFAGDGTASCVPADLKSAATAVQTFYEGIFLEQGYPITYMAFRIDHDGPFSAPRDPEDFDSDYWRSVEGPRLLFGRDTAETRRQKLKK